MFVIKRKVAYGKMFLEFLKTFFNDSNKLVFTIIYIPLNLLLQQQFLFLSKINQF